LDHFLSMVFDGWLACLEPLDLDVCYW